MARLQIDQISKSFSTKTNCLRVIDQISLDVASGEIVSIVGPSGCGKTTLLRIVAGLDKPDSGRVLSDGVETRVPSANRGVVFQHYSLFPWRTVSKNISFGLEIAGIPTIETAKQVREWIFRIGLDGFEDYYPFEISGGMQQRTALARTLITKPKVVLLDEPFSALDEVTRNLLQDEFQQLVVDEDISGLFVTHSSVEAVYLADKVVILSPSPTSIVDVLDVPIRRPRTRNEIYGSLLDSIKKVDKMMSTELGTTEH